MRKIKWSRTSDGSKIDAKVEEKLKEISMRLHKAVEDYGLDYADICCVTTGGVTAVNVVAKKGDEYKADCFAFMGDNG